MAIDLPTGLVVPDYPQPFFEAVANGDAGPPLGRELEIAELLALIKARRIRNVIFITADVHYCAPPLPSTRSSCTNRTAPQVSLSLILCNLPLVEETRKRSTRAAIVAITPPTCHTMSFESY